MAMKYIHSHVHTEIVDNSFTTVTSDGGTVGFFPIFSDKGKENEIITIDGPSVDGFVNTYGANADKFGQAHMNVIQWLSGGGTAAIMRLLPEDATYATAGLIVNVESYMPDYRIALNIKGFDALSQNYLVKENFIFDASIVKELRIARQQPGGNKFMPEEGLSLFRTGRGAYAEDNYDYSEDYMRKNGLSVEDLGKEVEESTGLLPVKSYVNYKMIEDFANYFAPGTEALSPAVVDALKVDSIIPVIFSGVQVKDTSGTYQQIAAETITERFNAAIKVKYNGELVDFTVTEKTEDLYDSTQVGKDLYGDPDFSGDAGLVENVKYFEVDGFDINDEFSGYTTKYFKKLAEKDPDGNDIFEQINVLTEDPMVMLKKIALGTKTGGEAPSTVDITELKQDFFAEPDKMNVYISFKDLLIADANALDKLNDVVAEKSVYMSDLIDIKVSDVQFKAQYFMDSYPIEVYSETVKVGGKDTKVWNARITVTDSDGVNTVIPIFLSGITRKYKTTEGGQTAVTDKADFVAKFATEDYVYRALNGLCSYTGKYSEINVGKYPKKVRGLKIYNYFNNGSKPTDMEPAASDVEGTKAWLKKNCIWCDEYDSEGNPTGNIKILIKDLNFDSLNSAVYSGDKNFSRMNADRITVELYTPPASKATSIDGVNENIKNYCVNYNNNISNLLASKRKYPVGYFASKCKGDYYNNYKIYLSLNNNFRDTYDFRLYDLTIYDEGGVQTKKVAGPFMVSLDKDAIDEGGGSMYIKSILDTYAPDCDVAFYDDVDINAFKNLTEDLASLFKLKHPKYTFDLKAVDPFFVPQVDENILSTGNPDYEFHSYFAVTDDESIPEDQRTLRIQGSNNISTASSVRLDNGFTLGGGSCGTLFDKRGNFIQSVYKNLLIKCFTGATNPAVMDTINNEFDVVLDAKYPKEVKNAIYKYGITLETNEGGVMTFLDTDNLGFSVKGPANTADIAVRARKELNPDHRSCAIFSQNTTAYDEYSSKDIPVSATYLLAFKIPSNDAANGVQSAFVGPRRGSVQLTAPMNWFPTTAEKEKLYKAQVNYISKDPKRTMFDCQLTSQIATSALSNIPNVRVLYKIKRAVRKICDEYRFERNTGLIRNQIQTDINEYLKTWIKNGACTTCAASVTANDYQIKQKMCQVDISIVFVGFLERINVTLTVNG